jgi:GTPase SAR1 family protein
MNSQMHSPIQEVQSSMFIPVDSWVPMTEEDKIFRSTKGAIILPCSAYYQFDKQTALDFFVLSPKRCYNGDEVRNHICHYMNYFLKYYDPDKELLCIYYRIKYLIDCREDVYDIDCLFSDINNYILHGNIIMKLRFMNKDNYCLNMQYRHNKNPGLIYTDKHAMILHEISLLMNAIIPLLTHFAQVKRIDDVDEYLLTAYDLIIALYEDVDIIAKIYETTSTTVTTDIRKNKLLWDAQDIRGINPRTQMLESIKNILLNIMPKYIYNSNAVVYNYKSIIKSITYQVTEIGYEYDFKPLSSSIRDEDNNSEFDRFESYQIKQDEALYVMNKVNCEKTMETIEMLFGPFDQDEINLFIEEQAIDGKFIINRFQKELIFLMFYKYFGDVTAIRAINKEGYIKLMIAARKILQANHLVIIPYIISSKVIRLNERKNLNKRELTKMESSPLYMNIRNKYRSDKLDKRIIQLIATVLSSEFQIISKEFPELHGQKIDLIPDMIVEEMLLYITLI